MSYRDGKGGKVEMVCDHKGCAKKVTADNKGLANLKAREQGWKGFSAAEHYCADHKVEHGARAPKASSNGKTAKAGKGKAKTLKATKKAGGVVSYTAVDE